MSFEYRYGFNGKENDGDVKGDGNQIDYGERVYDPRVGKFFSIDPLTKKYPYLTPYQFASNSPISGVDLDGLEYSPAGKVGIFAIDATAVQGYYNHPLVIEQQKANAPMVHLQNSVRRIHRDQAPTLSQKQPIPEYKKQYIEAHKEGWYDAAGYDADGKPKPLTRLAQNKTWNAFANNLALPALNVLTFAEGGAELSGIKLGLSSIERKIVTEANNIINSKEFTIIQNAYKTGTEASVKIGDRIVSYNPETVGSAITLHPSPYYQGSGFQLGADAFKSIDEIKKTLVHELFRLNTQSTGQLEFGMTRTYTDAAAGAADKLYKLVKSNK